ncbi:MULTISPECIES: copper amine oxidase N-terminal domain-containing protein [Paenibacillus]|uniref:copper amine oxidase N-terminal domain-containing protein n=1 Tax=Paenibacillus TaxID=44249 RepID=UPI0022B8B041|nr:copper amine oxidase N-terminal domain-containing protein [Paenibacillus caseinilyticus]MCZ8518242.1 copper amine oxidase N-terminal domain-containing protein [Paenibacillus caseinilyticus]
MHLRQLTIPVLAASLLLLGLPASTYSETGSLTETVQFPPAAAGLDEPLTVYLRGAESFRIAWRLGVTDASGLYTAADSTAYYTSGGQRTAVLPSGAQVPVPANPPAAAPAVPSDSGMTFSFPSGYLAYRDHTGLSWSYALPSGRTVRQESVQADGAGHVYFQDDAGGWYSLDRLGQERYVLLGGASLRDTKCRVAPSGDAFCASARLGLFGIRPLTQNPRLLIDGREQFYAVAPEVRSGVTLVPLRAVFEALQANVTWHGESRTIEAVKGNRRVILTIGSPQASVNGKAAGLEQPPVIENGTTLVPLRFVSEALGSQVIWEAATRTIQIVSLR